VRQGLGGNIALLPDDLDPSVDAFRAPLSAIRDADVCLVLGDEPVVERAPLVDLWLRAARRNGAEIVTVGPSGSIAVPPGSAPSVCYDLVRLDASEELHDLGRRLREAGRVAIVWSGDDHDQGRRASALAASLELGEGSGLYVLPRTPNGRGVAQAWREAGDGAGDEIPDGEIGVLIISGDEAAYDPRVAELAERARFVLATSMFTGDHTLWAHVVVPGTSYLERDGTVVNLEGRPQRQRRAVEPPCMDELEFLARVGEALGLPIAPWAAEAAPDVHAPLPPRAQLDETPDLAPFAEPNGQGAGLTLVTFHPLFSGPGVERIEPLAFQRPPAEIELSRADAERLGVANGQTVSVGTNGTTRELRARVNRRLIEGVARMADEHARGLGERIEVQP
jgi:NADH-quinone oxidoreductase subunit G